MARLLFFCPGWEAVRPSLTMFVEHATMFHMFATRIAAITLALSTCGSFAQEHPKSTLTMFVKDQTGAVIPGARITATDSATGVRVDGVADSKGQATVLLDQGTYELKVVAAGFRQEMAKGIEIKADTYLDATLRVADSGSGYPVSPSPEMPLERPALAAEISLIPTQQLVLEARPLRHRRRWL